MIKPRGFYVDNAVDAHGYVRGPAYVATHAEELCGGRVCLVHNPSDHHMRGWPLVWRSDKGQMERTCLLHGVGHPDPDDLAFHKTEGRDYMAIHGCCGCCKGGS